MRKILGIDPALTKTGWAVISEISPNQPLFVAKGVIKTDANLVMNLRLKYLASEIAKIAQQYNVTEAAIEETFLNKNPISSLKLGHARGAIIITLANLSLNISEYSATEIKKNITGMGRADKEQMIRMVNILLPKAKVEQADEADALACALCHLQISDFKQKIA